MSEGGRAIGTCADCVLCPHSVQQNPEMMTMMNGMQNSAYRENIEAKLQSMKEDPELASIMTEIEEGGPAAMMKCGTASGAFGLGIVGVGEVELVGESEAVYELDIGLDSSVHAWSF